MVHRVTKLSKSQWSERDVVATVSEAEEWGLGTWAPVVEMSSRVQKVTNCLQQGEQARTVGNTESLRDALRKGQDLNVSDEATAGWRNDLLGKNLLLLKMKNYG